MTTSLIYGHQWRELFDHYTIGIEQNGWRICFRPKTSYVPCVRICIRLGIDTIGM